MEKIVVKIKQTTILVYISVRRETKLCNKVFVRKERHSPLGIVKNESRFFL